MVTSARDRKLEAEPLAIHSHGEPPERDQHSAVGGYCSSVIFP
ncbi:MULTISPECIES: hypothetical protein [Nostocales]|uniref:Uncharacterized protein n=2 Tax=Nostocales TaxID=1161 RepID=A0ABW8WQR4_9CYAN|nr:hypothetical protein [Tolypothrix bouteillei]